VITPSASSSACAAGLLERELHRLAQTLEELDRGPAGIGEQRIDQASGEQGDASGHERHATRREGKKPRSGVANTHK
jgi:hypothetical protein